MKKVLLIDTLDPTTVPSNGGQSFIRQALRIFREQIVLAAYLPRSVARGSWTTHSVSDVSVPVLKIGNSIAPESKPLVPGRLQSMASVVQSRQLLRSLNEYHWIVQAPEVAVALCKLPSRGKTFIFHGAQNHLSGSRYWLGDLIAPMAERVLFKSLRHFDNVLVAADDAATKQLIERSNGFLCPSKVTRMPNAFDSSVFGPDGPVQETNGGLCSASPFIVTCGRLNRIKNQELILRAYQQLPDHKVGRLVILGDGEDRGRLEDVAMQLGIAANVDFHGIVPPSRVAMFYRKADVIAFSSLHEGWSIAMMEALATGAVLVSTPVSGSSEMIVDGANGYVSRNWTVAEYRQCLERALHLKRPNQTSIRIATQFGEENLRRILSGCIV